ncbi:MAG: hypothetical protein JO356_05350 [Acidobacteria bacterium]|nr:hypothetical protein [Acidobacteriota bacterium]
MALHSASTRLRYVTKVTCWSNLGSAYNAEKLVSKAFVRATMQENRVEEIVRSAVAQVVERQLASWRESVVEEVLRDLRPTLSGSTGAATSSSAALQKAISAIQAGTTQKEILRALLENTVLYSGRAALFVIKSGTAMGWQGIAFSRNDSVKDFPLDTTSPLLARVMASRSAESGSVTDFDQRFIASFGAPRDGRASLLPLVLKDKVSALVYADCGPDGGTLDPAALDVLVRATSAWLEVIAQRRLAHKEGSEASDSAQPMPSNDPFAAHAPLHMAKPQATAETAPAAAMSAAAAWGGAASVPPNEDAEIHHKAQRFARLLMDEIKLYNKEKVAEGRKHKDLYDRLKEDIEKSRATYQKRYGHSAAASADYFHQALIHSLAEDDVSLLGSNFRR